MKIHEAYTIYNNGIQSIAPQLSEAINCILDHQNSQLEKLDRVELAEVKTRMEIEAVEGYFSALLKKRVQHVEYLQTKNGVLNVFLQERTVNGWGNHVVDVAMQHIQKQEKEIENLRQALKYYADKKHYEPYNFNCYGCDVTEDEGMVARLVLADEFND